MWRKIFWEKMNDARKSINTAQKSISEALINYISQASTFFRALCWAGGVFELKPKKKTQKT